jgi:glutathione S-transferase
VALILYDRRVSGHCWKVRLMLGFCGLEYQRREIDILAGAARTKEFLSLNPRGEVPVLVADETTFFDSQAILGWLSRRHAPEWLPLEANAFAKILVWLSVASADMTAGIRAARAVLKFGLPGDLASAQAIARRTLEMVEAGLAGQDWLVGSQPTIADVAIYPYVFLAKEAGLSLNEQAAVAAWVERIQELPGYVAQDA